MHLLLEFYLSEFKTEEEMKTLLIYNAIEYPLKYSILEGDYSDLNGICINSYDEDENKVKKACSLLYDDEGNFLIDFSEDISLMEDKNWDKVAIITFIP